MNATAWDNGNFAHTLRDMPATIPALPTITPGDYPTTDQDIIAVQHIVTAATKANLLATWHHDNPAQVGEPIHAVIRLPRGRLISVFPRVNRDGAWWYELHHFSPNGILEGDWEAQRATTADQVVAIAQDWRDNPPA